MYTMYECVVYLADGKHVSQHERCESAAEAKERAGKWRALGHKARAFRVVVDLQKMEMYHRPLD